MTRTRASAWWLLIPVLLLAAAPAFGAEQAHKGPFRGAVHRRRPGADDRRPLARRSHAAHRPAGGDGSIDRRPAARPFAVRRSCCPTLQHALFPRAAEQKAMIDAISQFGILLLLLLTGMETDLKLVRADRPRLDLRLADGHRGAVRLRRRRSAMVLPEDLLPDPQQARWSRRCSSAPLLSIASVKIVAMVVREMNFTAPHRRPGHPGLRHHRRQRRLDHHRRSSSSLALHGAVECDVAGQERHRHARLHGA